MGFYDLTTEERVAKTVKMEYELLRALQQKNPSVFEMYFNDDDLYIRKVAYLALGRIYHNQPNLGPQVLEYLRCLKDHPFESVRQTVVNTAGEIGMFQFDSVQHIFDNALFDSHHKVRNAVIGSLKKMSKKNPKPVLNWADTYSNHSEKQIRRQICHGIELRGRTHPEDVLPILAKLQFEETKRVRDTLVHVLGQISYKKGCLPTVISTLKDWKDAVLVKDALLEIIDVHGAHRYAKFTSLNQQQAIELIAAHFPQLQFNT